MHEPNVTLRRAWWSDLPAAEVRTRHVLAAAYRGGRANLQAIRTHAVWTESPGFGVRPLCGRVKGVTDDTAADDGPEGLARPTCPVCLARDPRFREEHVVG